MMINARFAARLVPLSAAWLLIAILFTSAARGSEAAGESDREAALAAWTAQLRDADVSTRRQAVEALLAQGEAARPAVADLVRALGDEDAEVGAAAAVALAQLAADPERVIPLLAARLGDGTDTQRGPMWAVCGSALGHYGRAALPHVAPALASPSSATLRSALLAIDRIGADAAALVPDVIAILRRNDPETRIYAIGALRAIGPGAREAIPELVQQLSSDDFHTQYWACRALGAIGPEARVAAGELVTCLRSGATSVRRNAAAALGNIGPEVGQAAVEALIEALSDPSQMVRQNAVVALGQLQPLAAPAIPAIEQLLQEPSKFIPRAPAARTLWLLAPQSPLPAQALLRDVEHDDDPWTAAAMFREIQAPDEILQRLVALLDSTNVWTRQFAAVALLESGAEVQRARSVLEQLAHSDDEETRESAAASLARLQDRLGEAPDGLPEITARMQEFVDAQQISGAVTLVARRGKIVHLAAVGLADREANRPMQADTLFCIASMTKPVTATALMILQDEGQLSIDDPVSKFIPAFEAIRLRDGPPKQPITLRHCLTHTAGLGGSQQNTGTLQETVEQLAQRPLDFEPGTKWQYSPGLSVCGRVVEVVAGQPFAEFLAARIFRPLNMVDTTFHPSAAQQQRLARLYQPGPAGQSLVAATHWLSDMSPDKSPNPSGGLFSTAGDMARFYQMILNGGELDGQRIVSAAAVAEMTRLQTGELTTGFTDGNGWGLGWCLVRQPQGVSAMLAPGSFGHGGAFGTQGWVDPQRQTIFVLMIQRTGFGNSDGAEIRRVFQELGARGGD